MRVLAITGAGISAESGIPTFRGPNGYWRKINPLELATPEAFERDPELVWQWYRERREGIRKAKPNPAHLALVRLDRSVADFLLVTQNVDDLHERSGLPPEKIVQVHGDIFVTRCSRCEFVLDPVLRDEELPVCPKCGALMRPGVVWFGEQLGDGTWQRVEDFLSAGQVDLTLVVGTTAVFAYIVEWATRHQGRLIEINPEPTALTSLATMTIAEPAGIALPKLVEALLKDSAVD